jgi:hypothetical protein
LINILLNNYTLINIYALILFIDNVILYFINPIYILNITSTNYLPMTINKYEMPESNGLVYDTLDTITLGNAHHISRITEPAAQYVK